MRRLFLELIAIALLSAGIGIAINAGRHDRLPMSLPDAYYQVESKARPIFLKTARRLFEEGQTIFIDARSAEAYAEGQIEGACNVPLDQWQSLYPDLSSWIQGRKIVVYAGRAEVGPADDLALALASREKRDSLFVYIGGIEEWKACHLPMRTGPDPILGGDEEKGTEE